jgi:hypothetical protein
VDEFEKRHPGLVDFTKAYKACGNFFVSCCEDGKDLCGLCGRSRNGYDSGVYR